MDYLRSCYSTTMVFRVGDDPVPVQWMWAKEGAVSFPFDHKFYSTNWDSRAAIAGELGEQPGPKPWRNGSGDPSPGTSLGSCTIGDWFLTGIPEGELTPPTGPDHKPLCCSEEPFDCMALADTLTLTIAGTGDCTAIDQSISLTRVTGLCQWLGVMVTPSGNATTTVEFADDTWTLDFDCFTGHVGGDGEVISPDPLEVEWTLTDTGACCSFLEHDFTATLTE